MKLETDKTIIINKTKKYWYLILGFLLIFVYVITFYLLIEAKKEIKSIKSQIDLQEDIKKTEQKLDAMKKRETELYPQLQKKFNELESLKKQIQTKRKELQIVKKEGIKDEVEKMDINSINNEFNKLGYSTTIISGK